MGDDGIRQDLIGTVETFDGDRITLSHGRILPDPGVVVLHAEGPIALSREDALALASLLTRGADAIAKARGDCERNDAWAIPVPTYYTPDGDVCPDERNEDGVFYDRHGRHCQHSTYDPALGHYVSPCAPKEAG